MKKIFLLTQFGTPHEWTQEYIDHVQHLERYGWYWKIFTPNKLESKGNVEIISMTAEQFGELTLKKLGVRPNIFITKNGVPSVHVTDFYVASGIIFEDYIQGFDFWGITNFDVIYGRLDHYIPDGLLETTDVFTDDVNVINGVFSLFRNIENVNTLFKRIPHWKEMFLQNPCPKCMGDGNDHVLYGTDEYHMTEVMKKASHENVVMYAYPQYYPLHSHDRLEQHIPGPKLEIQKDGSLYELFKDINCPEWKHAHPMLGKEIMYFHFSSTKKWAIKKH